MVIMDFDRLNRETRDYNNGITRNISPTGSTGSSAKYGTSEYWRNYWNNKTYKENNGEYSRHYY
jgi:hypothetical protein